MVPGIVLLWLRSMSKAKLELRILSLLEGSNIQASSYPLSQEVGIRRRLSGFAKPGPYITGIA